MPLPSALPESGQSFGPYLIEGVLGRGGMGAVYRARHTETGAVHALKVIRADCLRSRDGDALVARFRREAQLMARVEAHPGIVRVHGSGVEAGVPWLALELVGGESLHARLQQGPLDPLEAAALVAQAARAVAHAHDCGVVHRDIKPHNLLIDSTGMLRVVDFGIAHDALGSRLTATGEVLGTPDYLSPEQLDVRSSDAGPLPVSIDVYGLGGVLYSALTALPPFSDAQSSHDLMVSILHREPLPPSARNAAVPADLEAVTLKCLRKRPDERFASASELADELERFARGVPLHTRVPGGLGRLWLRWRSSGRGARLATVALALALVSCSLAVGVWSVRREVARRSRRELSLLSAEVEQGSAFSPSRRATLERLGALPDLLADPRLRGQMELLGLLSQLDGPGADEPETALAIAKLVRPGGQIDEPLLALAERALIASARFTALHHVLYGVEPEALAPLRVAGAMARLITESDGALPLPRSQVAVAALLRAPRLEPQVLGQLLVMRGSYLLQAGPVAFDQALECFADAWDSHHVLVDNAGWPEAVHDHVAGLVLASIRTDPHRAGKLVQLMARLPRDLPPLPAETFGRVVFELLGEFAILGAGVTWSSVEQLERILVLASLLECHGQSLMYSQRARTLFEALGPEQAIDLCREQVKLFESLQPNPARLLVLARLVVVGSSTGRAAKFTDRLSLVGDLVELALRSASSQRWLLAGAASVLASAEGRDRARECAEAALLLDRDLPDAERWPVVPLLCSQLVPAGEDRSGRLSTLSRRARLVLEAASLQRLQSSDLHPLAVRPWPLHAALDLSEEIASLCLIAIVQRPDLCCVELDAGRTADTLLEHGHEMLGLVPSGGFRRRVDLIAGDLHRFSGHHHARHGRFQQAELELQEAIRRYLVLLSYRSEGLAEMGVREARAELERVRAAVAESQR